MTRRVKPHSQEEEETLRALRRAARRALELGLQTGTPVYIWKNGSIVDLTKEQKTKKTARRVSNAQKGAAKKHKSRKV